jgi:hypothetical protein
LSSPARSRSRLSIPITPSWWRGRLVPDPGRQAADPDLGQDIVGALRGGREIGRGGEADGGGGGVQDALPDARDELEPLGVEVDEGHLIDAEIARVLGQLREQLNRAAAARTNDNDLQRAPPSAVIRVQRSKKRTSTKTRTCVSVGAACGGRVPGAIGARA